MPKRKQAGLSVVEVGVPSTQKIRVVPLYSKSNSHTKGVVWSLPVTLGRRNLAETWWNMCPNRCHAVDKSSTPCRDYCFPVRRRSHREMLSKSMLEVDELLHVKIIAKNRELIHWEGELDNGSCRLSVGPVNEPAWMMFGIERLRAVTPDSSVWEQAKATTAGDRKRRVLELSTTPESQSPSRRKLFSLSLYSLNSLESPVGAQKHISRCDSKHKILPSIGAETKAIVDRQNVPQSEKDNVLHLNTTSTIDVEKKTVQESLNANIAYIQRIPQLDASTSISAKSGTSLTIRRPTESCFLVNDKQSKSLSDDANSSAVDFEEEENVNVTQIPFHLAQTLATGSPSSIESQCNSPVSHGSGQPLNIMETPGSAKKDSASLFRSTEEVPLLLPTRRCLQFSASQEQLYEETVSKGSPRHSYIEEPLVHCSSVMLSMPEPVEETQSAVIEARQTDVQLYGQKPATADAVRRCRDLSLRDWKALQKTSLLGSFRRYIVDTVLDSNPKEIDESTSLRLPPILDPDCILRSE